jgi:hypothetical protein
VLTLILLLVGLLVNRIRLLERKERHCSRVIVNVKNGVSFILKISKLWKKLLIMIIVRKNICQLIRKYLYIFDDI